MSGSQGTGLQGDGGQMLAVITWGWWPSTALHNLRSSRLRPWLTPDTPNQRHHVLFLLCCAGCDIPPSSTTPQKINNLGQGQTASTPPGAGDSPGPARSSHHRQFLCTYLSLYPSFHNNRLIATQLWIGLLESDHEVVVSEFPCLS